MKVSKLVAREDANKLRDEVMSKLAADGWFGKTTTLWNSSVTINGPGGEVLGHGTVNVTYEATGVKLNVDPLNFYVLTAPVCPCCGLAHISHADDVCPMRFQDVSRQWRHEDVIHANKLPHHL